MCGMRNRKGRNLMAASAKEWRDIEQQSRRYWSVFTEADRIGELADERCNTLVAGSLQRIAESLESIEESLGMLADPDRRAEVLQERQAQRDNLAHDEAVRRLDYENYSFSKDQSGRVYLYLQHLCTGDGALNPMEEAALKWARSTYLYELFLSSVNTRPLDELEPHKQEIREINTRRLAQLLPRDHWVSKCETAKVYGPLVLAMFDRIKLWDGPDGEEKQGQEEHGDDPCARQEDGGDPPV